MSDSRIDYQPLQTEALDSPTHHRFAGLPDTPGRQSFSSRDRGDEEEDDGIHADETQELVARQGRDAVEQFNQQQGQTQEDKDGEAGAGMGMGIRVQAFFCAALLGVSTHYTRHITGPLKDVLIEVRSSALRVNSEPLPTTRVGHLSSLSPLFSPSIDYDLAHGHFQHTVFNVTDIVDTVSDACATHRGNPG